jgi:hypothetical protein
MTWGLAHDRAEQRLIRAAVETAPITSRVLWSDVWARIGAADHLTLGGDDDSDGGMFEMLKWGRVRDECMSAEPPSAEGLIPHDNNNTFDTDHYSILVS